jgi:hypothetical protein
MKLVNPFIPLSHVSKLIFLMAACRLSIVAAVFNRGRGCPCCSTARAAAKVMYSGTYITRRGCVMQSVQAPCSGWQRASVFGRHSQDGKEGSEQMNTSRPAGKEERSALPFAVVVAWYLFKSFAAVDWIGEETCRCKCNWRPRAVSGWPAGTAAIVPPRQRVEPGRRQSARVNLKWCWGGDSGVTGSTKRQFRRPTTRAAPLGARRFIDLGLPTRSIMWDCTRSWRVIYRWICVGRRQGNKRIDLHGFVSNSFFQPDCF